MPMPITYALRLHGEAVGLGDGRFWAECRAPGCLFVPAVGPDNIRARLEGWGGSEAVCRRELELREDGSFAEAGEISFGADDAITFSAAGGLAERPDPRFRHGAAVCEVTGGRGRLAGARGYVTSNFLLSESGDLTDHQLGLLFLERAG
jgi:hypothetical protein